MYRVKQLEPFENSSSGRFWLFLLIFLIPLQYAMINGSQIMKHFLNEYPLAECEQRRSGRLSDDLYGANGPVSEAGVCNFSSVHLGLDLFGFVLLRKFQTALVRRLT